MKKMNRWVWAVCLAAGLWAMSAGAEEAAVVKKNRVNVRAQATPNSEVITQLKKGETVIVLEEIAARKPKRGEPAKWAKIQLPPNTPVWVYAPYIETTNNTVNIKRLNLRAGPGERFSIIGRIEQASGRKVQATRAVDPDLIGGIVLQAGSMRLDASVRPLLSSQRKCWKNRRRPRPLHPNWPPTPPSPPRLNPCRLLRTLNRRPLPPSPPNPFPLQRRLRRR